MNNDEIIDELCEINSFPAEYIKKLTGKPDNTGLDCALMILTSRKVIG